jgi:hypothetical protein
MLPHGDVAEVGMQLLLHLKLVCRMSPVRTVVTGTILDFPDALQANIGLVLQNIP